MDKDRDTTNKVCNCPSWKKNIERIDGIFVFAWIHGIKYEGETFEYCPWCGKQLVPGSESK